MPGQQQDFAAPYKDGRPRRKAAQEGKAAKDTEDPLVKLERVVELLDRSLLSVCEYELLKQHILTDLLSTALVACNCTGPRQGWRAASRGRLLFYCQGKGSLCVGGRDRSSEGDPGVNGCGGAGAARRQG